MEQGGQYALGKTMSFRNDALSAKMGTGNANFKFFFFFLVILKILKENPSAALQERLLENPILLCGLACAGHATERPIYEGRAQN